MFSPKHPSANPDILNPARRRTRQTASRPASRAPSRQDRHVRSGSDVSATRSERERNLNSQRRGSGSSAGGSDMAVARRPGNVVTVKDPDAGAVELTRNDKYRVSKLPGVPKTLKGPAADESAITALADSHHGYGLILARQDAYVWRYTDSHTIPHTYSFSLPHDEYPNGSRDLPFPLGTLVNPSANSAEPGLVVVMPMTGRVAYWDAIGSAVAEGLFQKKRGVEGKIPLMSGETVTTICPAEPAGFILSLSSGRLAHLALRDNVGRPAVNVTIMRTTPSGISSFFGALKSVGTRRDVVAVRAGKVLRMGEREFVVGTARGQFTRWHVNRSGAHANVSDVDMREQILEAVVNAGGAHAERRNREQFVILDMDVYGYGDPQQGGEDDISVLALAGFMPSTDSENALYALVALEFPASGSGTVTGVRIIKSYATPLSGRGRPRLYLPSPCKTAFVTFPRAVVIVSLLGSMDSNQMDVDEGSVGYEDVVDFRSDVNVEVVGSGAEDVGYDGENEAEMPTSFTSQEPSNTHNKRSRNPGVIIIAKGAGVLRIESYDLDARKKAGPLTAVTVKSKLEQAVFYAIKPDNPLNFQGREEVKYAINEVEKAAIEISLEILSSTSPYFPTVMPALDTHLKMRAEHLGALIEYLGSNSFGTVSRKIMWRLMSDAEKCDAAAAVWKIRNERLRDNPDAEEGVLEQCITEVMAPEDADITDQDPVRTWFQHNIDDIGDLLRQLKDSLTARNSKGKKNQLAFAVADAEANSIVEAALSAAWNFRIHHAEIYRLHGKTGIDSNGLLRESTLYPWPWTSTPGLLQALDDQYEVSVKTLSMLENSKATDDANRQNLIARIEDQLVSLAEICCRAFEERAHWCDQQAEVNPDIAKEASEVRERYYERRGNWIKPLAEHGQAEAAYRTAEKWRDYRTLVELCWEAIAFSDTTLNSGKERDPAKIDELKAVKQEANDRLEGYFQRFGRPFADTYYDYLIQIGELKHLLDGFENWKEEYLTPFLQNNAKYAKLAWIHDVSLGKYNRAADTLYSIATQMEDNLSHKRIELSIGKLAKLAAVRENGVMNTRDHSDNFTDVYNAPLVTVQVQQSLYDAVRSTARAAIDTDAGVQLLLDSYASGLKRSSAHYEILRRGFSVLIRNMTMDTETLVDMLTLARTVDGDGILTGEEFFWAITALGAAGLGNVRHKAAERTIWRRCYLVDDWASIASTRNQTDLQLQARSRDTSLFTTLRIGYERGTFVDDESPFRPMSPEDAKFTENIEEVRARFVGEDEGFVEKIALELQEENRRLDRLLKKTQLGSWWAGLVQDARMIVEEGAWADIGEEGDVIMG